MLSVQNGPFLKPVFSVTLCVAMVAFAGCSGGSGGGLFGSDGGNNGGGGGGSNDCTNIPGPRITFVSPSGDGTLFVGGTFPRTDADGKALSYKAVAVAKGQVNPSDPFPVTVVYNNAKDNVGHIDVPEQVNGLGQKLPWSSGDTIKIISGCGQDSTSVP